MFVYCLFNLDFFLNDLCVKDSFGFYFDLWKLVLAVTKN